jgi:hypothetical protein
VEAFRWLAERSPEAAGRWCVGLEKAIAKLEQRTRSAIRSQRKNRSGSASPCGKCFTAAAAASTAFYSPSKRMPSSCITSATAPAAPSTFDTITPKFAPFWQNRRWGISRSGSGLGGIACVDPKRLRGHTACPIGFEALDNSKEPRLGYFGIDLLGQVVDQREGVLIASRCWSQDDAIASSTEHAQQIASHESPKLTKLYYGAGDTYRCR